MWRLLLGTLLGGPALAHSPHDVASVLSLAPDGTVLTNDSNQLAVSEDGGYTFAFVTWADGEPLCAFADSRLDWTVAAEGGGLWRTEDGGESWGALEGPSGLSACVETPSGERLLAGPGGLWWPAGDAWGGVAWEAGGVPLALAPLDDGRVLVVDAGGAVLRWDAELGLEELEPTGALGLAAEAGGVLLGLAGAPPRWSPDGGDTWTVLAEGPADARVLALRGEERWAASAEDAVWYSADEGLSWTLEDEGLDELAEGAGGPGDGVHYFHIRPEEDGGRVWLASFEGLYWQEPGEARWIQGALDTIPRVRTVAWLPEGELLVGSYGGGVACGRPGEGAWQQVGGGIGWPWPKQIQVAPGDPRQLFVVSGSALYASPDAGQSWDTMPVLLGEAGDAMALAPAFPEDPRLAQAGRSGDGEAGVSWSEDAGESWTITPWPGACRLKPTDILWQAEQGLWAACGTDGQLARSEDGGQTLEAGPTVGSQVEALVADDAALWLATGDGLWRLAGEPGDEALVQHSLAGVPLTAAARVEGGLLVGAVGAGLILVDADDGGAVELGWPGPEPVEDIAVSEDGLWAVGLRSGSFTSADEGATWTPASTYDRVDEELQHWTLSGWAPTSRDGAMRGRIHRGEAGAWAELRVDGVQIRLVGESRDGARLRLSVDGEDEEIEVQGDLGVHWGADLAAGVHVLEVEVLEGVFALDGAERWRAAAPALPDTGSDTGEGPTPEDRRCGCGAGAAGALVFFLPVLAGRRTRPG